MKRAHRSEGDGGGRQGEGKCKMMAVAKEELEQDAGVDELLAALGYKVRSSDMAEVAQKLEQLEVAMAIGTEAAAVAAGSGFCSGDEVPEDNAALSHLASETVHYNPSDLSAWLESMLSEFHPPSVPLAPAHPPPPHGPHPTPVPPPLLVEETSSITTVDLPSPPPKRLKISCPTSQDSTAATAVDDVPPESSLPIVMVDSQETGIRLVHTLLGCAQAVQDRNLKAAEALVKQIGVLSLSQGGSMRKVATYFAEALARRIYNLRPTSDLALESAFSDLLQSHFYETCPYLKFAHFTANQAILEALVGKARVHVIDFGMKQGMQWPPLMQALALRPGGPPFFHLTGIGPPQPDNTDALQQVGWKLAQLAETIHIEFEYRGFVANSLADLEPYMLELGMDEAVAVNSMFELHRLLNRPGAIEKVFRTIKALKPSIVTVVEEEANHNGPVFLDRFTEALHYYSSMFDSVEGCGGGSGGGEEAEDRLMTELYLGRQICNVVACEGEERVERHETLGQWKRRMAGAGFEPAHLGSNAFKQASMLLALFAGGDGYRVEEKDGCLMLGWHTRPLITTSAWKIPSTAVAGGDRPLRSPRGILDPSDL